MQEKWRKMFLILRCSVPPEIMTGFCLPCFVRFYCTVAKHFGVSHSIVHGILSGKNWKHVDRESIKKEVEENAQR